MEDTVKIEEQVLEALKELGFKIDNQGDGLYAFETGISNIVYETSEDESFLRFILPFVLSLDDISEDTMNKAIQLTNDNMKYVKAYMDDKDCFLAYERKLFDWDIEHLQDIIEHQIECLNYTKIYIHSLFGKDDDEVDDSGDTTTGSEQVGNDNNEE